MSKLDTIRSQAEFRLSWEDLDPGTLRKMIQRAQEEDTAGEGLRKRPLYRCDVTSRLMQAENRGEAFLVARKDMVLCGMPLVPLIFGHYDSQIQVETLAKDGDKLDAGAQIAKISGSARSILTAERIVLNFLQMLSGVATQTARYVAALGPSETRLLDTRKTTPGFRLLEKYAVACGGGWNHRLGLYDRVMLKDNHLAAAGATDGERLTSAVLLARQTYPDLLIEVEVDHIRQIPPVLEAGADIFLLDNFDPAQLSEAIEMLKGQALTEASGGIEIDDLAELGTLGLDYISIGALTHQARWQDIGLDWS